MYNIRREYIRNYFPQQNTTLLENSTSIQTNWHLHYWYLIFFLSQWKTYFVVSFLVNESQRIIVFESSVAIIMKGGSWSTVIPWVLPWNWDHKEFLLEYLVSLSFSHDRNDPKFNSKKGCNEFCTVFMISKLLLTPIYIHISNIY